MTLHNDLSRDDHEDCHSWYTDESIDQLMARTNKVSETEAINDSTIDSSSSTRIEERLLAMQNCTARMDKERIASKEK